MLSISLRSVCDAEQLALNVYVRLSIRKLLVLIVTVIVSVGYILLWLHIACAFVVFVVSVKILPTGSSGGSMN